MGDGIAWVYGLPSAAAEEILHFEDGSRGMVFELQAERLGVILLDPAARVTSGSLVSHTGERLEIGVGDSLLGRVIDPLGKPLDDQLPAEADGFCALESASPPIVARDFVNRPLYTGIKVVDTLIPIGRGQRQLIIGDSGTGQDVAGPRYRRGAGRAGCEVRLRHDRAEALRGGAGDRPVASPRGAGLHHGGGRARPPRRPA